MPSYVRFTPSPPHMPYLSSSFIIRIHIIPAPIYYVTRPLRNFFYIFFLYFLPSEL